MTLSISAVNGKGLDLSDLNLVEDLVRRWHATRPGNLRNQRYYDQKNLLQDFRISTPPSMRHIEATLGWAAKPVDVLAERITFEKFVIPGQEVDVFGLSEMVAENDFVGEFAQTTTSALISSCAFITASHGLEGEPDVVWVARTADEAVGVWDRRARNLSSGLTVQKLDTDGFPIELAVWLPEKIIILRRQFRGVWEREVVPNATGRMLMKRVAYKPHLKRPFGQSRISRAVRYYQDAGMRTIVRSEVGAEFFTAPQRYALGVNQQDFKVDRWSALVGRFLAMGRDNEGLLPEVGQFPQISMQPHTDQLRMWASLLSGETGIPIGELGFVSDNPSSDAAIQSQRDPMRLAANSFIRDNHAQLRDLAITSVMLREGLSSPPAELLGVEAKFAPTVHVTESAMADAILKQTQAMPWLAETDVILERLGYDSLTIDRLLAEKRRLAGGSALDKLLAGASNESGGVAEVSESQTDLENAQVLKAKADALGVLRRAGVNAQEAASAAGLPGIKFDPGMPITLKQPGE